MNETSSGGALCLARLAKHSDRSNGALTGQKNISRLPSSLPSLLPYLDMRNVALLRSASGTALSEDRGNDPLLYRVHMRL
jgi:hypothetical protein